MIGLRTAPEAVTIQWADGRSSSFDHLWLRDNCQCAACLHPDTHERLFDVLDLEFDLAPSAVELTDDVLLLAWPDGHRTDLAASFLRTHAYDDASRDERRERYSLWRGDDLDPATLDVDYRGVVDDDAGLAAFLDVLWSHGLAIVRGTPDTHEALAELCHRVSWMRETNFGVDFEVEAKPDPNNVAYTAVELQSHTDLPNREMPPGVQFLHCRRADAVGGASTLVDGFAAADELRRIDPDAYDLLCTVEVPFRFQDEHYDVRWRAPVIGTFSDGQWREVRYHHALMAPLDVEAHVVRPVYAALQAFTEVLRQPGRALEFTMAPGDMIVFHNRRVLHGRRAFDPTSGHRHLHGGYVDVDELRSKMRVLARKL